MSLQLEKGGFDLKYHDQSTKTIQISAKLYIFFLDRTVRCLLCTVSGGRPGQDLYRRPLELVSASKLGESKKDPRSIFPAKGKLALMFLKNYSGFSDRKLMEQLNGNLDW